MASREKKGGKRGATPKKEVYLSKEQLIEMRLIREGIHLPEDPEERRAAQRAHNKQLQEMEAARGGDKDEAKVKARAIGRQRMSEAATRRHKRGREKKQEGNTSSN